GLQFAEAPFPESEGLGVRVVDSEDLYIMRNPKFEDALQLLPQAAPRRGFEVERVDVLVLLRRVFRVLHRAVGPRAEPLRMLAHVRMVGRALEGDIERDMHASFFGF